MSGPELLTIGTLAEATGTTITTLRYYDELGLVPATCRIGGKRRFDPASIGRVDFVRRAKQLGFSLEHIRSLLDDTDRNWPTLVAAKLDELRDRMADLEGMITILEDVQSCGCVAIADCDRANALTAPAAEA